MMCIQLSGGFIHKVTMFYEMDIKLIGCGIFLLRCNNAQNTTVLIVWYIEPFKPRDTW